MRWVSYNSCCSALSGHCIRPSPLVVVTPGLLSETHDIELSVGLSSCPWWHVDLKFQFTRCGVVLRLCEYTTILKVSKHSFISIRWLHQLRLIVPHCSLDCPGQNSMNHVMVLCLANHCDTHGLGCFIDGVVIWFAVWLKPTKGMDLCLLVSVLPWGVALSYPHFVHLLINMLGSIYIMDCVFPKHDVKFFYIVHSEQHHIRVAVIPQFEFQAHLLASWNHIIYLGVCHLHDHPSTVALLQLLTLQF